MLSASLASWILALHATCCVLEEPARGHSLVSALIHAAAESYDHISELEVPGKDLRSADFLTSVLGNAFLISVLGNASPWSCGLVAKPVGYGPHLQAPLRQNMSCYAELVECLWTTPPWRVDFSAILTKSVLNKRNFVVEDVVFQRLHSSITLEIWKRSSFVLVCRGLFPVSGPRPPAGGFFFFSLSRALLPWSASIGARAGPHPSHSGFRQAPARRAPRGWAIWCLSRARLRAFGPLSQIATWLSTSLGWATCSLLSRVSRRRALGCGGAVRVPSTAAAHGHPGMSASSCAVRVRTVLVQSSRPWSCTRSRSRCRTLLSWRALVRGGSLLLRGLSLACCRAATTGHSRLLRSLCCGRPNSRASGPSAVCSCSPSCPRRVLSTRLPAWLGRSPRRPVRPVTPPRLAVETNADDERVWEIKRQVFRFARWGVLWCSLVWRWRTKHKQPAWRACDRFVVLARDPYLDDHTARVSVPWLGAPAGR